MAEDNKKKYFVYGIIGIIALLFLLGLIMLIVYFIRRGTSDSNSPGGSPQLGSPGGPVSSPPSSSPPSSSPPASSPPSQSSSPPSASPPSSSPPSSNISCSTHADCTNNGSNTLCIDGYCSLNSCANVDSCEGIEGVASCGWCFDGFETSGYQGVAIPSLANGTGPSVGSCDQFIYTHSECSDAEVCAGITECYEIPADSNCTWCPDMNLALYSIGDSIPDYPPINGNSCGTPLNTFGYSIYECSLPRAKKKLPIGANLNGRQFARSTSTKYPTKL